MKIKGKDYKSIWFENNTVKIIDQTKLPHKFIIKELKTVEDTINSIINMEVRGAPLIGATAAFGVVLAIIEKNEPTNNVFSSENADIKNTQGSDKNISSSSQAWVAEIGLDIRDNINFAVQAPPDRDDLPPLGILTLQAFENLELIGSSDSDGNWKSQIQLFLRY